MPHPTQATGVAAAGLFAAGAAFQLALALGAPYGDAVLGGRADTVAGVLTGPYRWVAAGQGLLLVGLGGVVLARAGLVPSGRLGPRGLRRATGVVAGLMLVNTVGNLASPSALERWMGAGTATAAVLCAVLARPHTADGAAERGQALAP